METRICDIEMNKPFTFKYAAFATQKGRRYIRIEPLNENGLWIRNLNSGEISMVINTNAPVIYINNDPFSLSEPAV